MRLYVSGPSWKIPYANVISFQRLKDMLISDFILGIYVGKKKKKRKTIWGSFWPVYIQVCSVDDNILNLTCQLSFYGLWKPKNTLLITLANTCIYSNEKSVNIYIVWSHLNCIGVADEIWRIEIDSNFIYMLVNLCLQRLVYGIFYSKILKWKT